MICDVNQHCLLKSFLSKTDKRRTNGRKHRSNEVLNTISEFISWLIDINRDQCCLELELLNILTIIDIIIFLKVAYIAISHSQRVTFYSTSSQKCSIYCHV